jgi:hypothetical protein
MGDEVLDLPRDLLPRRCSSTCPRKLSTGSPQSVLISPVLHAVEHASFAALFALCGEMISAAFHAFSLIRASADFIYDAYRWHRHCRKGLTSS